MRSKSLFVVAPGRSQLSDVELDKPAVGEVLIKGAFMAIGPEDARRFLGEGTIGYPSPIGEALSGTVEALGPDVQSLRVGDRVTTWAPEGRAAGHWIAEARDCVRADERVALAALATTKLLARCFVAVDGQLADQDIAIVGDGPTALGTLECARLHSPRSIVFAARSLESLACARKLGAAYTFDLLADGLPAAVCAALGGRAPGRIYDTSSQRADSNRAAALIGESTDDVVVVRNIQTDATRAEELLAAMRKVVALIELGWLKPLRYTGQIFPIGASQQAMEKAARDDDNWLQLLIDVAPR